MAVSGICQEYAEGPSVSGRGDLYKSLFVKREARIGCVASVAGVVTYCLPVMGYILWAILTVSTVLIASCAVTIALPPT